MGLLRKSAFLILCLFAMALAHQVLPHSHDHGSGNTCPLCLLLTTVAVPVSAIVLAVGLQLVVLVVLCEIILRRPFWQPLLFLRGPPPAFS
jgi:hypothetical protein